MPEVLYHILDVILGRRQGSKQDTSRRSQPQEDARQSQASGGDRSEAFRESEHVAGGTDHGGTHRGSSGGRGTHREGGLIEVLDDVLQRPAPVRQGPTTRQATNILLDLREGRMINDCLDIHLPGASQPRKLRRRLPRIRIRIDGDLLVIRKLPDLPLRLLIGALINISLNTDALLKTLLQRLVNLIQ